MQGKSVGKLKALWIWIKWNWQPLMVTIFFLSFIFFLIFGITQQLTNVDQESKLQNITESNLTNSIKTCERNNEARIASVEEKYQTIRGLSLHRS